MRLSKILLANGGLMNRGGIESYMMSYYRQFDRSKIQIDFLVHDAGGYGYYDEEIKQLGGHIFVLPQKSKQPLQYQKQLKAFLKDSHYNIIHTHMDAMGAYVLKVAKECGIPVRIAHSHNTQHLTQNRLKLLFLEDARKKITKYSTHNFACSEAAGRWLFGEAPFDVVKNAIDIDKFRFDPVWRKKIREQYQLGNHVVIGHVGRFDHQKNHLFLIDVFELVHKKRSDTKLLLIGEGHLQGEIKTKVKQKGLQNSVVFTGVQEDVHHFYNAFDLFVLPSLFEGFGIVSLEAGINGCQQLVSDQVPADVKISDRIKFLPLNKDTWKQAILQEMNIDNLHSIEDDIVINSGFDIKTEAQKLQEFYLSVAPKQ